MKARLTNDNIQQLKALLTGRGIDPNSIEKLPFHKASSFRTILVWVGKILCDYEDYEELNVIIKFEHHPLSELDAQIGLFYVDSVLGFDTYSRKWYVGDIATWRDAAQKVAFEDNWERWIKSDFVEEIETVFSVEIDKAINTTGIRQLFDIACRRAKYRCPIVKEGKDCYCNVEIIVEEIGYEDLHDCLGYEDVEGVCIDYVIRYFSLKMAKSQIIEIEKMGIASYGLEDMTGSEDYLAPGREPEIYVCFDVPRNVETDFRKFYSSLDVGISIKRDGEEIARAIPPATPEEHRLWCELSKEAYAELVEDDA